MKTSSRTSQMSFGRVSEGGARRGQEKCSDRRPVSGKDAHGAQAALRVVFFFCPLELKNKLAIRKARTRRACSSEYRATQLLLHAVL